MAWIESNQELGRHPKTKRLARLLGVSTPAAVGHLHFLWWWAMDFAQAGDLSQFEAADIADACEWSGDAEELLKALVESRFLDEDMQIHDWLDYAGRLIEKREQNNERKRRSREKKKDSQGMSQSGHADVTRTSRGQEGDGRVSHGATVPNSTVPNNNDDDTNACARVIDFYQRNIGMIAPAQYEYINDWLNTYDADVLILAIKRAIDQGVPKWTYINKTLDAWLKCGAKTLSDCEAQIVQFEREKGERYAKSQTGNGQTRSGRDSAAGGSSESEFAFLDRAGRS